MDELRFRSRIEIAGINPYVPVDPATAGKLASGWRRPMPVRARIGASTELWRTNITPMGDGSFRLHLHGGMRKAAGVDVGDDVEVALSFDAEYRGGPAHPMPAGFADELNRNPSAQTAWAALPPSQQKELLRYFAGLKSAEALERNIQRAIHVLSGGKARFLGRSWNESSEAGSEASH